MKKIIGITFIAVIATSLIFVSCTKSMVQKSTVTTTSPEAQIMKGNTGKYLKGSGNDVSCPAGKGNCIGPIVVHGMINNFDAAVGNNQAVRFLTDNPAFYNSLLSLEFGNEIFPQVLNGDLIIAKMNMPGESQNNKAYMIGNGNVTIENHDFEFIVNE
jgi:hypothetical protein